MNLYLKSIVLFIFYYTYYFLLFAAEPQAPAARNNATFKSLSAGKEVSNATDKGTHRSN
jgi:hypothetical protein